MFKLTLYCPATHNTGLLPPVVLSLEKQGELAMRQLRSKSADIEKYIFLQTLQDTNEVNKAKWWLYLAQYPDLYFIYLRHCIIMCFAITFVNACQSFTPQVLRIAPHEFIATTLLQSYLYMYVCSLSLCFFLTSVVRFYQHFCTLPAAFSFASTSLVWLILSALSSYSLSPLF